jgi:hypothetical protein
MDRMAGMGMGTGINLMEVFHTVISFEKRDTGIDYALPLNLPRRLPFERQ